MKFTIKKLSDDFSLNYTLSNTSNIRVHEGRKPFQISAQDAKIGQFIYQPDDINKPWIGSYYRIENIE